MKKFKALVFLFAFISILGFNNFTFADNGNSPSDWAKTEINEGISKGLVLKDLQKNYQKNITRKEFCKLSVHMYAKYKGYDNLDDLINGELKERFNVYDYPFLDLDRSNKDDKYIFVAHMLGFVNGMSSEEFSPDSKLTREQAAKILSIIYDKVLAENLDVKEYFIKPFDDDKSISDWARNYVYYVKEINIMKGMGNNLFKPKDNYSVEQAIITILRVKKEGDSKKGDKNEISNKSELNDKLSQYRKEVIRLINIEREKTGLNPFKENPEFQEYSDLRAKELATNPSHTRPDGSKWFSGIASSDVSLGENIAAGQTSPEEVVNEWMNSDGHRANILRPYFTHLNIGIYYDKNSEYGMYWEQLFSFK